MQNIDRIRQMTVDELAEILHFQNVGLCSTRCIYTYASEQCKKANCKQGIRQWLEQESEE